ncbi:MAG TPA: hypothetical protein VFV66_21960 [Nonomuraea sp.]|nr:hypothetical protein [Nonomuraea sp.]
MHLDRRLLGWGGFFVIAGAIPLAVRGGVLDTGLVSQWLSLWPILLIGWGLGLILRRTPLEWIGGAVTVVVLGVMAGGALSTGLRGVPFATSCGDGTGGSAFATQRGTFTEAGQLNLEFNCGALAIAPVGGSEWSVAGTDADGRVPRIETAGTRVTIEQAERSSFFGDAGGARWDVGLPTDPDLDLGITLNAGDGTANLAGATISTLNLNVNAGSFRVDASGAAALGDVNASLNAGSATLLLPAGDRLANLSMNAGSLDVCLPPDTPVRVAWSSTLGSNNFDDAGMVSVDDTTWTSAGFDPSASHLELRVSVTAGSFGLVFGSGCND